MLKKLLIVNIIFILISFLFINNNVFAVEVTPSALPDEIQNALESNEYYNNSTYDYLVYNYDSNYCICFIKKTDTLKWYVSSKGGGYWFLANEIFASHEYIYNSSYELTSTTYGEDRDWTTTYRGGFVNSNLCFLASFDIYTDNTYTDFFFEAPVTTILVPVLEKVEMMEPVMREILTLVPIMIILIVSYLGLRKGLTFIKILRKM